MADPTIEEDLEQLRNVLSVHGGSHTLAMLDRIKAALKAADWQPIPSPPPNGTAALAAPNGGVAVGTWDAAFGTWGVYLGEQDPTHYIALPPTPFERERARKQGSGGTK